MKRVATVCSLVSVLALTWSSAGVAQKAAPAPSADFRTLWQQAGEAWEAKDHDRATRLLREAMKAAPDADARAYVGYTLAAREASRKRRSEALQALAEAVRQGFSDWQSFTEDDDFKSLRGSPELAPLVAKMKALATSQRVFEVTRWDNPDLGWASLHRFDEPNHPKMKELREEFRLGDVIAGKKSELDRQLALMAWVHGRWRHDGWNDPSSSEALTILREAAAGKQFRCVEYSTTVAQVLQAMGFPARAVSLRRDGVSFGLGKGHVVSEVWNNELGKWVLFDAQNNATWHDGPEVLNVAEVRERFLGGKAKRLRMVHHGSPWIKKWNAGSAQAAWIVYFHHVSYGLDNNVLTRGKDDRDVELIRPGERHELLFQGVPQQGHAQTGDPARIYPRLNFVHIDVGANRDKGAVSNVITASLSHAAPGFDHYLVAANGKVVQHRSDTFPWPLVPGPNALVVRAVNQAGIAGPPAQIDITYHPQLAANSDP